MGRPERRRRIHSALPGRRLPTRGACETSCLLRYPAYPATQGRRNPLPASCHAIRCPFPTGAARPAWLAPLLWLACSTKHGLPCQWRLGRSRRHSLEKNVELGSDRDGKTADIGTGASSLVELCVRVSDPSRRGAGAPLASSVRYMSAVLDDRCFQPHSGSRRQLEPAELVGCPSTLYCC